MEIEPHEKWGGGSQPFLLLSPRANLCKQCSGSEKEIYTGHIFSTPRHTTRRRPWHITRQGKEGLLVPYTTHTQAVREPTSFRAKIPKHVEEKEEESRPPRRQNAQNIVITRFVLLPSSSPRALSGWRAIILPLPLFLRPLLLPPLSLEPFARVEGEGGGRDGIKTLSIQDTFTIGPVDRPTKTDRPTAGRGERRGRRVFALSAAEGFFGKRRRRLRRQEEERGRRRRALHSFSSPRYCMLVSSHRRHVTREEEEEEEGGKGRAYKMCSRKERGGGAAQHRKVGKGEKE